MPLFASPCLYQFQHPGSPRCRVSSGNGPSGLNYDVHKESRCRIQDTYLTVSGLEPLERHARGCLAYVTEVISLGRTLCIVNQSLHRILSKPAFPYPPAYGLPVCRTLDLEHICIPICVRGLTRNLPAVSSFPIRIVSALGTFQQSAHLHFQS